MNVHKRAAQEKVLAYLKKSGGATLRQVRLGTGLDNAGFILRALVKEGRATFGCYGGYKVQWDRVHEVGWKASEWDRRDPSTIVERFKMFWPLAEAA